MASDSSIGTRAWNDGDSNVNNAKIEDGVSTYVIGTGTPNEVTKYLRALNFGFSLPSNVTSIDGILAEIKQSRYVGAGAGNVNENAIRIVKSDNSKGSTNKSTGALLPGELTYVSYGGASDLWGESWSVSDINSSNFGVVYSVIFANNTCQVNVDHIRITIYYTYAAATMRGVSTIQGISSIMF